MEIQISSHRRIPGLKNQTIRQKLKEVLEDLGLPDAELSILLTNNTAMSELNRRYLGKDGPTNVLAFPMSENPSHEGALVLGDVVVSVDTAVEESGRAGEPLERTVFRLLIHGVLHLLGHDHERSPKEDRRMRNEEKRLLKLISGD